METRHFVLSLSLLVVFVLVLSGATTVPQIRASRSWVSYQDRDIRLDCLTPDKITPRTNVTFNVNGQQVFNSSGKLGPGVTKINATAMRTTQITNGLSNVFCQVNSTRSGYIAQIPYVYPVTFWAVPSKLVVGKNFTAICAAQVAPFGNTAFNVTFTKDQRTIALYTIVGTRVTWKVVPTVPGIWVYVGNVTSKDFSATIYARTKEAQGKYNCAVTLQVPGSAQAVTFSGSGWNTNGGLQNLSSLLFIAFCTIFATMGFKLSMTLF